MRQPEEIFRGIHGVNCEKRMLIEQYLQAQNSDDLSLTEKLLNTKRIFYELRRCNDLITDLETELVSILCYSA